MANERLRDAILRNGFDLEHIAKATDVDTSIRSRAEWARLFAEKQAVSAS